MRGYSVAASASRKMIKAVVFLACLIPLGMLTYGLLTNGLGANPVKAIIHGTGVWTLRLLLLTLLVTPLRRIFGWAWPIAVRRMLGLFAFFYALLHLFTYLLLDQSFDWQAVVHDVVKRPFITAGMLAFTLMVPLAATSTNAMVRRLGRNWKRLHRLAYVIPA
ncbi:MAG TPA: protein-methionine-sulfoxide reductase heme-binding subunit MsrQ, partial [Gammaproteobacteria bacterium]|nr:protein-methionine-sulfoxide reductase heme-binding subunit MsrQ [Gammaproteobacteria bacterium]